MLSFLEKIFSPSKIEVKIEKFEWIKKNPYHLGVPSLWKCKVEGKIRYTYFWWTTKEYPFKVKKDVIWYYEDGREVSIFSPLHPELERIYTLMLWEAEKTFDIDV